MPSRTTFAATLMLLAGGLQFLGGVDLIREDGPLSHLSRGTALYGHFSPLDGFQWGWIHLVLGGLLALVGALLALRSHSAPWPSVGVVVTLVSGLAALWAPFDITSGYLILVYVVILWALTTDPDRAEDVEETDEGPALDD